MATRSKTKPTASGHEATSEENMDETTTRAQELSLIEKNMLEKDARLRAQEAQLRRQFEELQHSQQEFEREKDKLHLRENELLARERDSKEKWSDHHDVSPLDHTQNTYPPFPGHIGQAGYNMPPPLRSNDTFNDASFMPKITFREATDSIPLFDGYNTPLLQFTRACRRAREMIPAAAERNLTKLLINKLRNRAYYAVEDQTCETVTQLVDLLTRAFGQRKTINEYRAELSTVFMKPNEHILDYISRVKDLRSMILDVERREKGQIDLHFSSELDELTKRTFLKGLPFELRVSLPLETHSNYLDVFATATDAAYEREAENQRYEAYYRDNRNRDFRRLAPIGSPLAHSTPQRSQYRPAYRANDRSFANRNDDDAPRYRDNTRATTYRDDTRALASSRQQDIRPRSYLRRDNNPEPRYTGNYRHEDARAPTNNVTTDRPVATANKWCRYCKKSGHEIEECRKRQYNNDRRPDSGNPRDPSRRTDAPRADPPRNTRPIHPIEVTDNETSESQS